MTKVTAGQQIEQPKRRGRRLSHFDWVDFLILSRERRKRLILRLVLV